MEVTIGESLKISIDEFKAFDKWAELNGYKYFPPDEWYLGMLCKKSSLELYNDYLRNKKRDK